jgi:ribosomal protein S18 acetylase RimI-like enzyme
MIITITPCTKEDLDVLVRISKKTFREAFEARNNPDDFEEYLNSALSPEKLGNELEDPRSQFYFLYLKSELAGFYKINEADAQTDLRDPRALELERIYVISEYQGLGLGRKIIDHVVRKARDLGKGYIWLGVWEENTRAIAFYEDLGFVKFGRHPYFIGTDRQMDWLMRLDLSPL